MHGAALIRNQGISKSGGKSTFYLDKRTGEEAAATPGAQAAPGALA